MELEITNCLWVKSDIEALFYHKYVVEVGWKKLVIYVDEIKEQHKRGEK